MRPISIPAYIQHYWSLDAPVAETCMEVNKHYQLLAKSQPVVSIVIPAYNEEENIVRTLLSLSKNVTQWPVEIIVVNNNSVDQTEALATACGVTCVLETKQGITNARNRGLAEAKGKFILNADADTLYPLNWIEAMIQPLAENEKTALTYGRFSFIPVGKTGRLTYFFYEYVTDYVRIFHRKFREEAVNVYGFNSGFRRAQGEQVDGFNHPPGTNEDGWLALKLRDKGFGKLHYTPNALVWTTDRRIQIDGGLWKGTVKRVKRFIKR